MKELPESETYEESLAYWPYKTSVEKVLDLIDEHAPEGGTLLDTMCGPGYLLGEITKRRGDLLLTGVDSDERYVEHGKKVYSGVRFEKGDVLTWQPETPFDVVICTGSLHHVSYDKQEHALAKIASATAAGGLIIISDCYIDDYSTEIERKLAAAKLGYEYLKVTIENGAPDPVVGWTSDILWNDVMMAEFKTSLSKRLPLFDTYFAETKTIKTWPEFESGYGDYIHVCRR